MTVETDGGATFTIRASIPGTRKITRTANLTAGGLAKFGADGVLEKASASSTGGETADYRDPTDNVCHKTEATEWTFSGEDYNPANTYRVDLVEAEGATRARLYINDVFRVMSPTDGSSAYFGSGFAMEGEQTEVTATRSVFATKDEPFVTTSFMTNRFNKVRAALDSFAGSTVSDLVNTLKNALKE